MTGFVENRRILAFLRGSLSQSAMSAEAAQDILNAVDAAMNAHEGVGGESMLSNGKRHGALPNNDEPERPRNCHLFVGEFFGNTVKATSWGYSSSNALKNMRAALSPAHSGIEWTYSVRSSTQINSPVGQVHVYEGPKPGKYWDRLSG